MSSIVPRTGRMGEEPLVEDLAECLRQLDEIDENAGKVVGGLSEDQFHWSPGTSRWSIAQCLVHLVIVTRRYLPLIDGAIELARMEDRLSEGPFRYGFVDRWLVRATEPPPGIRLRTPASARPPDDQPIVTVLAYFFRSQQDLRDRIRAADGLDLARVKVKSPYAKSLKMGLGPCFSFLAAHQRRHLWQAWQVRRHEDFPPEPPLLPPDQRNNL